MAMMLIVGIMIAPILAMLGPIGWIGDAGVLLTSIIGLFITTGGNILKIFEK